ncbi:YcjX family protein [uncultured Bartonella sp.]|uniref:YcjX family protein n=1 Tax=uncultured Bartonella sp. TaxID=104108 RepID=UPI00262CA46C|nr:YcjX family protein [uncultured Bartonella sp.]
MPSLTTLKNGTAIAFDALSDRTKSVFNPTLKLGVTGLSNAGKTVFITSLIENLLKGKRLPVFGVMREGRLLKVKLAEQPDSKIARFEFEKHIASLLRDQTWPDSTRELSQIRLQLDFSPRSRGFSPFRNTKLNLDIIDYPGEWLLDLPLLDKSYRQFCRETIARAQSPQHKQHAQPWLAVIQSINFLQEANEHDIETLSRSFKNYLSSAKKSNNMISSLAPGHFLVPGNFENAPILSFSPILDLGISDFPENSIAGIMEQRYEAYKKHIVFPFFREYIACLDRQVILVDSLDAINDGKNSIDEMKNALGEILLCFKTGKSSLITKLMQHKIDRILIASTKVDHLHHSSHDRLEKITTEIVTQALKKAQLKGVITDTLAMSSIRSTKEGLSEKHGESLPVVIGTPKKGEKIGDTIFDGVTETAIFPGDLPDSLTDLLDENWHNQLQFVRFRPPKLKSEQSFPQIRLDRAMEFLFGDYLI